MIQTIIQNNNTGQTAVTDLPQSRMNMAGMLASIGIRQPAYQEPSLINTGQTDILYPE